MKDKSSNDKLLNKNKKAFFNYEMVETLECGMSLEGTEVKSMREGRFSFTDSYVVIENGQLLLLQFTIQPYKQGSIFNHDPDRKRKLLAHKSEIKRLKRKVDEKGLTLVPTKVYLKNNIIKMEIGLARGKALHDKKNVIKERDLKKDAQRELKRLKY
ncbi:MAG: SsrA-binding protein SmpB [Sphaerochaetaceae bacterium]|nr:SsrA-binding protein SmpB [Sphaerochaetaceae bacterium]MDC7237961.1 SsrA-binding protein SmpB [Sphaerochaetaceae bacterium]MDC7248881.1 SsrA-binding protein SmpB [Sphaerochaetaceae bacterium]